MRVETARYENGELHLKVPPTDARVFVYKFKPGEFDIIPAKTKRSLNANSYAWLLINKIAEAVRESPQTIYKQALKDVPNICEALCVRNEAVEATSKLWVKDHIGRRVETRPSKLVGCTTMFIYYGSSDFDTRQMSILIDNLVQDAKQMGIETRPEDEIKALLEAWNG